MDESLHVRKERRMKPGRLAIAGPDSTSAILRVLCG